MSMTTCEWSTGIPEFAGYYLITSVYRGGSKQTGYSYFNGSRWMTANRQAPLSRNFEVIAYAKQPEPFQGLDAKNMQTSSASDPWEKNLSRAEESKQKKHW